MSSSFFFTIVVWSPISVGLWFSFYLFRTVTIRPRTVWWVFMNTMWGFSSFIVILERKISCAFMWLSFSTTLLSIYDIPTSLSHTSTISFWFMLYHFRLSSGFMARYLSVCSLLSIASFASTTFLCFTATVVPIASCFPSIISSGFTWVLFDLSRTFSSCSKNSLSLHFVALFHLSAAQYVTS